MTEGQAPPPAPGRRPLVGHTVQFLRRPLESLQQWARTDDDLVSLRVGGRRACLVTDPDAVEAVLVGDAASYRKAEIVRERLGTLQGGSLVLLEGERWRERRRTLASAFAPSRISDAQSVTTEYATEAVEAWPTDRPVRIDERSRDLSLSILARVLFGLDLRGERTPIHDAAADVLARMDVRSVSAYLPEWVPTPTNRRFRRAVATLHDRIDDTVEGRRPDDGGGDLLSTMLAAGMDHEDVRDELIAFLFAGFDSTATALTCTLALLAENPDVQSRLRRELRHGPDATPTAADLLELPLLDAVVRESLRLYPPQYVLFREPVATTSLGGYRVDAGTIVLIPPWVLHRDPDFWAFSGRFRPERWLDDRGPEDRPEFAYIPYGGGPRRCLGARMADQTLKLAVATVCRHRTLEAVGDLSVTAGPTLSFEGGVAVRVRPVGDP